MSSRSRKKLYVEGLEKVLKELVKEKLELQTKVDDMTSQVVEHQARIALLQTQLQINKAEGV